MSPILCALCCVCPSKAHVCSGGMHMRVTLIFKKIHLLEWVRYIQMLPIVQHYKPPSHLSLTLSSAISERGDN